MSTTLGYLSKCERCQKNCQDTIHKLGYFGEQNNPNSKLGCFWQVAHTAVQHCLERVGKESFIFPFEIGNMPKKPFEAH